VPLFGRCIAVSYLQRHCGAAAFVNSSSEIAHPQDQQQSALLKLGQQSTCDRVARNYAGSHSETAS
jgi:hypothetical protein